MALLILRVVIGLLFVGHGAQKLFGWFGGHGLDGTADFFAGLGFVPGTLWALVAGLGEFLGGLGLALGLFTPVAAAAIIGVMLMAIIKVHWENGLWNQQGGFEYPLLNAVVASIIGLLPAGLYSLDSLLNINYPMPTTFWISLVVAIAGVIVGLSSGQVLTQPESEST
jgi:putative oxidoreductase